MSCPVCLCCLRHRHPDRVKDGCISSEEQPVRENGEGPGRAGRGIRPWVKEKVKQSWVKWSTLPWNLRKVQETLEPKLSVRGILCHQQWAYLGTPFSHCLGTACRKAGLTTPAMMDFGRQQPMFGVNYAPSSWRSARCILRTIIFMHLLQKEPHSTFINWVI